MQELRDQAFRPHLHPRIQYHHLIQAVDLAAPRLAGERIRHLKHAPDRGRLVLDLEVHLSRIRVPSHPEQKRQTPH